MDLKQQSLPGGEFCESLLVGFSQSDWPNQLDFRIWSPFDAVYYKITCRVILEFHFARLDVGTLDWIADGLPLGGIYLTEGPEFMYWLDRIETCEPTRKKNADDLFCIEFDSHIFAHRRYETERRDSGTGLLVVCRDLVVRESS